MSAGRAETKKLIRKLEKQGFDVVRTSGGHWRVSHPEREGSVVMGFSPSSTNLHNQLNRLKKLGYQP